MPILNIYSRMHNYVSVNPKYSRLNTKAFTITLLDSAISRNMIELRELTMKSRKFSYAISNKCY